MCIDFICEVLDFEIHQNAFKFEYNWSLQRTGVVMGMPVASTLANLFLAMWEENFVYVSNSDIFSIKYIDDTLVIWSGHQRVYLKCVEY